MKEKHFTTIYDKDNAALTTAGVAGETPWLECWDSTLCVADAELTALGIERLQWKAYGYRADVVLVKGGGQQPCLSLRARQYVLLLHGGLQWRVA